MVQDFKTSHGRTRSTDGISDQTPLLTRVLRAIARVFLGEQHEMARAQTRQLYRNADPELLVRGMTRREVYEHV